MINESDRLLKLLGVDSNGLDSVYLQVLEIIGAIRKRGSHYANNDLDRLKLNIFWKTMREITEQYIYDDIDKNTAIDYVMNAFPDQNKSTDGRIWLPMHFAMSVPDINLDDIQILFNSNPDCISQGCDTEFNYTPCHLAVMSKDPDMNLIEMLKEFDPSFGLRQTMNKSTAIHLAAEYSNSIPVIQELIREFPAALTMRDEDQSVPIARAFQNNAVDAPDIFRILLQAAPQTATESDDQGRFLLDQCLNSGSKDIPGSEEIVSIMLEAFPDAVNIADNAGWLPIQLAALTCRSEVFKMIAEANPAHLSSYNPNGGTVAHMAVNTLSFEHSLDKLKYIHSIQPQLLLSLDQYNWTPLANAVQYHSIVPTEIEEIASLEPAAAIKVGNNGDNLLHMMIENCTLTTETCNLLKLFIRLIPGGAIAVNNHGHTPYDLLDPDNPDNNYARRLLLLAGAPSLHPETRKQMNYQARKGALFVFFAPRGGEHHSGGTDICHRIRHGAGAIEIIREIVSFL